MTLAQPLNLRLQALRYLARDTVQFEFARPDGGALPACEPGAHIDVHTPGGAARQYSLLESGAGLRRWRIAVKLDAQSRGGSQAMHALRVGTLLDVVGPRNQFALVEDSPHTVLIAAGIGITPIYSMLHRLRVLSRSWELHYLCRTRDEAAFVDELTAHAPNARLYFTREGPPGRSARPDLGELVRAAPAGSHYYACGPADMLKAFADAAANVGPQRVHVEHFGAQEAAATAGGYVVELSRSGLSLDIAPGTTILQALRQAGIAVPTSCEEGVCGACETRVLNGTPDHRDAILTPQERADGETMMVCCSGCKSARLVLDL